MHFSKRSSYENLFAASAPPSTAAAGIGASTQSPAPSPSSSLSLALSSYAPKPSKGLRLGWWCFLLLAVVLMAQQQPCECRYLPTRSHGDDLDKLRELMLQILESSNEEQRPPNEANGNTLAGPRTNWLNRLGGMEGIEVSRKYGAPHGMYDNGRYY